MHGDCSPVPHRTRSMDSRAVRQAGLCVEAEETVRDHFSEPSFRPWLGKCLLGKLRACFAVLPFYIVGRMRGLQRECVDLIHDEQSEQFEARFEGEFGCLSEQPRDGVSGALASVNAVSGGL